jgi:hypothetical protein
MPKKTMVSFDEENLDKNEKYFIENPSTLRITEPKTPYHKDMDTIDFNSENLDSTWHEESNKFAAEIKDKLCEEINDDKKIFKNMRKIIYKDEGKKFIESKMNDTNK